MFVSQLLYQKQEFPFQMKHHYLICYLETHSLQLHYFQLVFQFPWPPQLFQFPWFPHFLLLEQALSEAISPHLDSVRLGQVGF